MKTRFLLISILSLGFGLMIFAQETTGNDEIQTLFNKPDHKVSHGGYAAFTIGYTQISGENVLTLGGRAGWLIDHHVTLGLTGTALANSIYIDKINQDQGMYLVGGYGGFFVEPIIAPRFPVHVSFPVTFGGGWVGYNENTWWDEDWNNWDNDYDYEDYFYDSDAFFLIEPGVEIELNVVKCLRVSFGATYRFTTDFEMVNTPKDMMNGFSANMSLKLGKF